MTDKPIEIANNNTPTGSVIWLHGLGADGNDFSPVVDILSLAQLRFILPHAPFRQVSLNNGYEMRAWYDLFGLTANAPQDEAGIHEAQHFIESLIENEIARGIPSERIAIVGFSQGGAIALHTALRYKHPLAGVIALSTYLPLKNKLAFEKSLENQHIPILMVHGAYDEVISLDMAKASMETLQSENYDVNWLEFPIAHSVSVEEIDEIRTFLMKIMK
jgi:phospholipase/carboxylesterase